MWLFFRWHPCSLQKHRLKRIHKSIFRACVCDGLYVLVVCRACRIYEHLRNQPPLQSTFSASPRCHFPMMSRCLCHWTQSPACLLCPLFLSFSKSGYWDLSHAPQESWRMSEAHVSVVPFVQNSEYPRHTEPPSFKTQRLEYKSS